jgi:hypothetical protein
LYGEASGERAALLGRRGWEGETLGCPSQKDNGFIPDFLRANAVEVENMLYANFELDKALQAARNDAWEDGMECGMERGKLDDARAMLRKGYPIEDIIDITELSFEEINRLKTIK